MRSEEYEQLIKDIVAKLYEINRGIAPEKIGYGKPNKPNKIGGISGYLHQIDVSLEGSSELILIECKRWNSRISVKEFLTHLGRINDISPRFSKYSVSGMIFTTRGFQKGVYVLAKYYRNIELVEANSVDEIIFKYGENLRIVRVSPPPATASVGTSGPAINITNEIEAELLTETSQEIFINFKGKRVWLSKDSCLIKVVDKNKLSITMPSDLYDLKFR